MKCCLVSDMEVQAEALIGIKKSCVWYQTQAGGILLRQAVSVKCCLVPDMEVEVQALTGIKESCVWFQTQTGGIMQGGGRFCGEQQHVGVLDNPPLFSLAKIFRQK